MAIKKRTTSKQKAASRRNLEKARAAKKRGAGSRMTKQMRLEMEVTRQGLADWKEQKKYERRMFLEERRSRPKKPKIPKAWKKEIRAGYKQLRSYGYSKRKSAGLAKTLFKYTKSTGYNLSR